ncbi:MAG: hypothetical protein ACJAVI_000156 [Candidatus Azotimanducaceae bacterium]
MFSFLKSDPTKKLRKAYLRKLEQALHFQRNGKIREYSLLTTEAEAIKVQIDEIERNA